DTKHRLVKKIKFILHFRQPIIEFIKPLVKGMFGSLKVAKFPSNITSKTCYCFYLKQSTIKVPFMEKKVYLRLFFTKLGMSFGFIDANCLNETPFFNSELTNSQPAYYASLLCPDAPVPNMNFSITSPFDSDK